MHYVEGSLTEWRELRDVARGTETVSRGLEVILQIWRLRGYFCRAHGASAPPPSADKLTYRLVLNIDISQGCFYP